MPNNETITIQINDLFRLVQEYKEFIKELPRETTEDWIYIHNLKIELRTLNRILNALGIKRSMDRLREKRIRIPAQLEMVKQEQEEEQYGSY